MNPDESRKLAKEWGKSELKRTRMIRTLVFIIMFYVIMAAIMLYIRQLIS